MATMTGRERIKQWIETGDASIRNPNTADVLDFNLFLSPKDVWTADIAPSSESLKGKICFSQRLEKFGIIRPLSSLSIQG